MYRGSRQKQSSQLQSSGGRPSRAQTKSPPTLRATGGAVLRVSPVFLTGLCRCCPRARARSKSFQALVLRQPLPTLLINSSTTLLLRRHNLSCNLLFCLDTAKCSLSSDPCSTATTAYTAKICLPTALVPAAAALVPAVPQLHMLLDAVAGLSLRLQCTSTRVTRWLNRPRGPTMKHSSTE